MQGNISFQTGLYNHGKNINPGVVDFSSLKRFKYTLKKIDFSPYLKYSCD